MFNRYNGDGNNEYIYVYWIHNGNVSVLMELIYYLIRRILNRKHLRHILTWCTTSHTYLMCAITISSNSVAVVVSGNMYKCKLAFVQISRSRFLSVSVDPDSVHARMTRTTHDCNSGMQINMSTIAHSGTCDSEQWQWVLYCSGLTMRFEMKKLKWGESGK